MAMTKFVEPVRAPPLTVIVKRMPLVVFRESVKIAPMRWFVIAFYKAGECQSLCNWCGIIVLASDSDSNIGIVGVDFFG